MDMSNEMDLAWLAGIVDGEGYIRVRAGSQNHNGNGDRTTLMCSFKLENTSMAMISRVTDILDYHEVHYSLRRTKPTALSRRANIRLEVWRKGDVLRLCQMVLPYITAKKDEFELVEGYLSKAVLLKYYTATPDDLKLPKRLQSLRWPTQGTVPLMFVAGKPKLSESSIRQSRASRSSNAPGKCRDDTRDAPRGKERVQALTKVEGSCNHHPEHFESGSRNRRGSPGSHHVPQGLETGAGGHSERGVPLN